MLVWRCDLHPSPLRLRAADTTMEGPARSATKYKDVPLRRRQGHYGRHRRDPRQCVEVGAVGPTTCDLEKVFATSRRLRVALDQYLLPSYKVLF